VLSFDPSHGNRARIVAKDLGGEADPSAALPSTRPSLGATAVLVSGEVEHHTQAHREAKGTQHSTRQHTPTQEAHVCKR
jgi:hypothetical protein